MAKSEYGELNQQRFRKTLNFIGASDYRNILDLGSYQGDFGRLLKRKYPESAIFLVDMGKPADLVTCGEGVHFVPIGDMNKEKLPFARDYFDLVTNLEMIEHLYTPDNLLAEIHRILKPGGTLVLSTPNLASWVNRILLLFGYFPKGMSISIKCSLAGRSDFPQKPPLKSWKEARFDYHIRAYTFSALKVLLEIHNFKVIERKGIYGLESLLSNRMVRIMHVLVEKLLPSMAQFILIRATAEK